MRIYGSVSELKKFTVMNEYQFKTITQKWQYLDR